MNVSLETIHINLLCIKVLKMILGNSWLNPNKTGNGYECGPRLRRVRWGLVNSSEPISGGKFLLVQVPGGST